MYIISFIVGFILLVIIQSVPMIGNSFFLLGVALYIVKKYSEYCREKNFLSKYYAKDADELLSVCNGPSDGMNVYLKWVCGEVYAYIKDRKKVLSKKICKFRVIYTVGFAFVLFTILQLSYKNLLCVLFSCVAAVIYIKLLSGLTLHRITYNAALKNKDLTIADILDADTFESTNGKKSFINILICTGVVIIALVSFVLINFESSYDIKITDGGWSIESCSVGLCGVVEIPAEIDGKNVVAISEGAFEGERLLKEVVLPDTITTIESRAFKKCYNLETIKLPDSLVVLNGESFMECHELKNIIIPSGVTEIRGNTFENCYSLKSVGLHDGIIDIHAYAFSGCESLVDITLPTNILRIAEGTFEDCTSLNKIVIPDGVTEISAHAFYNCSSLSEVIIPESILKIGSSAFRLCESLYSVTLPVDAYVSQRAFKDSPTEIIFITVDRPEKESESDSESDREPHYGFYNPYEYFKDHCTPIIVPPPTGTFNIVIN